MTTANVNDPSDIFEAGREQAREDAIQHPLTEAEKRSVRAVLNAPVELPETRKAS